MKKFSFLLSVVLVMIFLAACGSADTDLAADSGSNVEAVANEQAQAEGDPEAVRPDFSQMEVPLQTQLILGTFALEDTEYVVDATQAAELLPYWQVLLGLLNSDTAAAEEIDAVVSTISDLMTPAQMDAIAAMEISVEDSRSLMEELGLAEEFQRPEGDDAGDGTGPGRGGQGGMGPGGGGGQGGETGLTPEQMATLQAEREAAGGGGGQMGFGKFNASLIEALIELLEGKISS